MQLVREKRLAVLSFAALQNVFNFDILHPIKNLNYTNMLFQKNKEKLYSKTNIKNWTNIQILYIILSRLRIILQ